MHVRATSDPRLARAATVAGLLVLGAMLLQSNVAPSAIPPAAEPTSTGGHLQVPLWPALSTAAVLLLLVAWRVASRLRRRHQREPRPAIQPPPLPIHPAVKVAVVLFALAVPWLFVLVPLLAYHLGNRPAPPPPTSGPGPAPGQRPASAVGSLGLSGYLLAALALVVVLAGLAVLLAASRKASQQTEPADREAPHPIAEEADAVATARRAIREDGSDRDRIVGAFVALERALAEQGMSRARTETPDELLTRISSRQPGLHDDAANLTHTFQYARFSNAPVSREHLDTAQRSLTRLERALRSAQ